VVGRIWIKDHWYNVEYEGLHIICGKYGCYGHYDRDYKLVRGIGPTTVESNATAQVEVVHGGGIVKGSRSHDKI